MEKYKKMFLIKKLPLHVIILIIVFLIILVNNVFNSPEQKNVRQSAITIADQPETASYRLKIEKIGIDAPIVLNVDGADKQNYFNALVNGVAHMKNSALPGNNGNMVIFGHSSIPDDYKGKYGETFTKLNNLEIGDTVAIVNMITKDTLNFAVKSKKIIGEKEISVVESSEKFRLTLLTCWPIGTHEKRLVIVAE